jgi:sugar lactone lactonase YvrE
VGGLGFPESTRWRDARIWVCNWGGGEVLAVSVDGRREVIARLEAPTLPFSIDWLPDGRLLVIDGRRQQLLGQARDGSLTAIADLSGFGPDPFNELVVDRAGNAYVNGGPGIVVYVGHDGSVREVADGLQWPNGMALIDDGRTLVVADSHADGSIRVRADAVGRVFEGGPDTASGQRAVICDFEADDLLGGSPASRVSTVCACAKAARCSTPSPSIAAASPACSVAMTAGRCSSPPPSGAAWTR